MGDTLSNLKIKKWWHAITVVGAGGMVICLPIKFDFIPQRDAFMIFLGMFLFGIGQWIDHPIQSGYYVDRIVSYTTKGYHYKPSFVGVSLQLLGGMVFVIEILKILRAK
jgi:hypothetical protein